MSDEAKGATALIAVVTALLTLVGVLIKTASDFDSAPFNPVNQPKLSWHEVCSNKPKPVEGMYCSTIEVEVQNDSRVMVEHVGVLIKTLTKDPCINCEGGTSSKATHGHWLVEIPKLTGHNTVKVVVTEWLPVFPPRSFMNDEDGFGYAGHVVKATYQKGPVHRRNDLCKLNFVKLEPIPIIVDPPTINKQPTPSPVPPSVPKKTVQALTLSVSGCGCGKPNCRCGAKCRCRPVTVTPHRIGNGQRGR